MMKNTKRSWNNFKGAKKKSPNPLTPEQERIRFRLWERWAEEGKNLTVGRWNMASACARTVTAYPRDHKWARRMRAFKGAAGARRKYADPVTGKLPFANGFFDPHKASAMSREKMAARKEQRLREQTGSKLKSFVPGRDT